MRILLGAVALMLVPLSCTDNPQQPRSAEPALQASTASDVILVGAGDIATCSAQNDEATANLLDSIPGTVFTAGDNAYDNGTAADFANCYDPSWGRQKARTRPAPGNHDYYTTNASGYFGYFGAAAGDPSKGYYSYDIGSWHIVVLNNYKPMAAGTAQETWLRSDLAASSKQCTLAVWHEPLFSSGMHANTNTAPLWQALYAAGAEVVIVGHDHDYERFAPQTATGASDPSYGIREFVVGTGGDQLGSFSSTAANSEVRNSTTYGVLKLTLQDGGYTWQFVPIKGQTFTDSGSGGCHGAPGGNQPPTAAYSSSCSGLSCVFTDQSSDPDGHVVNWSWAFGDGTTSQVESPSHSYSAAGTYSVRLAVTDDKGATNTVIKSIAVGTTGNQPPAAAFTFSCSGLTCGFTDQSTDPDGTVTAWSWSFGDSTTSSAQNPTHTFTKGGTYSVKLVVTDNQGAKGSITKSVTVTAPNQPPTAAFTSSCTGLGCTFTDQSTDPDGTVSAWSWAFGDGATATTRSPTHTYGAAGTYSVKLTVTDNSGATGTVTKSVTVAATNQPPTAAFTSSCSGLGCTFTDQSTDPDGTVSAWSWNFGDGGTSTTRSPTHSYATAGTYSVKLTVTDNSGATGTVTKSLTVAATNQAPAVSAGPDASAAAGQYTLSASFSDPDGDGPWTYVINWGDLLASSGSTSSQGTITATHLYAVPGTYTIRVTVTDSRGASGSDTKVLTVTLLP